MGETRFEIRLRVLEQDTNVSQVGRRQCPACGRPMMVHQPDQNCPHRLLANCSRQECGVWFAVIIRPDDRALYLVQLPSMTELVEAISLKGWGSGPLSRDVN